MTPLSLNASEHTPVMLREVLESLSPQAGETYVDGTFGAGGYSRALLNAANCTVYGIDRDPDAVEIGKKLAQENPRFQILQGNFSEMDKLLESQNITHVDGVVLDLGVSSMQLDQAERGFSFQKEGPLDMRMEQRGETAAHLLNTLSEKEIAHIIWYYGDEPKSRSIARAIVSHRQKALFTNTLDLTKIIHSICKRHPGQKIDPATKTFQAIRIYINKEIESLEQGLMAAERLLREGGRLVIVSFHSLEDRPVKAFLQLRSGKSLGTSRHQLSVTREEKSPTFQLIQKKTIAPTDAEIRSNPRARSAKLRWAVRTSAQPWESVSCK
jgi:16S rRNA (cytosine1402-N4)-methyltransferase